MYFSFLLRSAFMLDCLLLDAVPVLLSLIDYQLFHGHLHPRDTAEVKGWRGNE